MATELPEPTRAEATPASDAPPPSTAPLDPEQVSIRAYECYCARGREDGHDVDDWVEAERQLREEASVGRAAP